MATELQPEASTTSTFLLPTSRIIASDRTENMTGKVTHPVECSFCTKSQDRVKNLIAGPAGADVYICDQCVRLCNDMIESEVGQRDHLEQESTPKPHQRASGWGGGGFSSINPPPLSVALKMIKRQLDEMSERIEVLAKRAEDEDDPD